MNRTGALTWQWLVRSTPVQPLVVVCEFGSNLPLVVAAKGTGRQQCPIGIACETWPGASYEDVT